MEALNKQYYKQNETDKIWWLHVDDNDGLFIFSFDRKKDYNLFGGDYPEKLTPEEREIFKKEQPEWAEFFKEK